MRFVEGFWSPYGLSGRGDCAGQPTSLEVATALSESSVLCDWMASFSPIAARLMPDRSAFQYGSLQPGSKKKR